MNWALFYSLVWTSITLPIVNNFCVIKGFWCFNSEASQTINIPLDILFVWVVFWAIIPFYFLKGKYTLIVMLFLFWIDIILMPKLEEIGILQLNENWLIGEIIVLIIVWLPSYLWAKFYYNKTHLNFRALFQVIIMGLFISIILPFSILTFTNETFNLKSITSYHIQLIFIIVFPSLAAVNDLVKKGNGTPFPYDKTNTLVRTGVYAYCKNPIQWSFTLLFIPLSIYFETYLLLIGSITSIAYTLGISNPQEYKDMQSRFNTSWATYKETVPSWMFLWKPKNIPKGVIYFKKDCNQCEQIKNWFEKRNHYNLEIKYDYEQPKKITQVTYRDHNSKEYKSVRAIANGLEHINLLWACLGWFMRFPLINDVLQIIVDNLDPNQNNTVCTK